MEVTRQLLLHNPHYPDGHTLSARSDMDTEDMAVRWATSGVVKVEDVLHEQGERVLSPEEFVRRWPALAPDVDSWKAVLRLMPEPWHAALSLRARDDERELPTWHTDGDCYWHRWTQQATDNEPKRRMAQLYTKEEDTMRLMAITGPATANTVTFQAAQSECLVRPVQLN